MNRFRRLSPALNSPSTNSLQRLEGMLFKVNPLGKQIASSRRGKKKNAVEHNIPVKLSPERLAELAELVKSRTSNDFIKIFKSVSDYELCSNELLGMISEKLSTDPQLLIQFSPDDIVCILKGFSQSKQTKEPWMWGIIFKLFSDRIVSDPNFASTFNMEDIAGICSVYVEKKLLDADLYNALRKQIVHYMPKINSIDLGQTVQSLAGSPFEDDIFSLAGTFVIEKSEKAPRAATIHSICLACSWARPTDTNVEILKHMGDLLVRFPILFSRFSYKELGTTLDAFVKFKIENRVLFKIIGAKLCKSIALLNDCDAEGLSQIANGLFYAKLEAEPLFESIIDRITKEDLVFQFSANQLSKIVDVFSRRDTNTVIDTMFSVIGKRIIKDFAFVDTFNPNDISMILQAFCRLELLGARIMSTPGVINQFTPQAINHFLESYSKASVGNLVLFNLFATAIIEHPTLYQDYTPLEISRLFHFCGKLGVKNNELLLKLTPKGPGFLEYPPNVMNFVLHSLVAADMVDHHYFTIFMRKVNSDPSFLKNFVSKNISRLLHVFFKVDPKNELFEAVEGLILKDTSIMATISIDNISAFLNSFSKRGEINPVLIDLVVDRILFDESELDEYLSPQCLCMLIYDFSNLSYRHETLFQVLGQCLIKQHSHRLHEFTPLGIANILNGFCRLRIRNDELFTLLVDEIVRRKDFFAAALNAPSAIFKILFAVKFARMNSKPLFDLVNRFINQKENLVNPNFARLRNGRLEKFFIQ
jgi:hypothetical protein